MDDSASIATINLLTAVEHVEEKVESNTQRIGVNGYTTVDHIDCDTFYLVSVARMAE